MIDLALLSNPSLLQSCCVIPPLSNSDHSGLCLTIRRKNFPVEFCLGNVGTILKQTLIEPVNSLMLSTGIYYCNVHLVTLMIYGISGMRSSCPFLKSVYLKALFKTTEAFHGSQNQ